MEAKLTILGCGSAVPSLIRANSGQVLEIGKWQILIDCGEGTQLQLLKCKISPYKFDAIFISHLHGDHFFGLPGLLNTLALYGRKQPLKIFGPPALKKLLSVIIKETTMHSSFEIEFISVKTNKKRLLKLDEHLSVTVMALKHRIDCYGYHFQFKQNLIHINKAAIDAAGLGVEAMHAFKNGENYLEHLKDNFTFTRRYKVSYTYITDTLFMPELAGNFRGTNLLYHETTYLNNLLDKAHENWHSTTHEAAKMAILSKAKTLLIGHFSSRYTETTELLTETKALFENTELAVDGKVLIIK